LQFEDRTERQPSASCRSAVASDKSFRLGSRIHVGLFAEPGYRKYRPIFQENTGHEQRLRDHFQIERADGLQNFEFFVANSGGVKEAGGSTATSEVAEEVTLNHIAERTGSFIKSSATLDLRFRGGDCT